jgi:hypothetical protein
MTSLVQGTAIRQVERVSDFGVVALFSLIGIVLSLVVAHWGLDPSLLG